MKILVMGGTRFVGKSLVNKLISNDYQIDIFTRGNRPCSNKLNHIKGDRNDLEDISKLKNKKYDFVFDISGRELIQTKTLIESINQSFERYIYVSSAGVYKDNYEFPITEKDSLDSNSRHKGKAETEKWLKLERIPFTSFRPTYIYGPGNYNKIENWFFERIIHLKSIPLPGDGSLITQLGHVSDLTDAMMLSMGSKLALNNIYNCSGDKGITIKGLINSCIKACNFDIGDIEIKSFNYQKLDPKSRKGFPIRLNHYLTSISKLREDLNWSPKYDLFNGLKDSYENDYKFNTNESLDPETDSFLFQS